MKILILNTHSVLNPGDTAIVLGQIQFLKKRFPNARITLTSRTPEIDQRLYGKMGIKVVSPFIPTPSVFTGTAQKMEKCLKNIFDFPSKMELIREIEKSDLVIGSGGGYFFSNRKICPGPVFLQNFLHLKMASLFHKPLIFFPQSYGPFFNSISRSLFRNLLEEGSIVKIFAREEISFHQLLSLLPSKRSREMIDVCPDLSFYLKKEDGSEGTPLRMNLQKPVIAITLRRWDFPEAKSNRDRREKEEQYLTTLQELCRNIFCVWGGSVVVFPQVRGPGIFENDRIISKHFLERVKNILPEKNLLFLDLPDVISPFYIIHLLSQVDLVIATRFHSAVFALISCTPVVSIHYQPKGKGIMELLGLEHFSVDITRINVEDLLKLTEEILNNYPTIQKRIGDQVSNTRTTIETKLENVMNLLR